MYEMQKMVQTSKFYVCIAVDGVHKQVLCMKCWNILQISSFWWYSMYCKFHHNVVYLNVCMAHTLPLFSALTAELCCVTVRTAVPYGFQLRSSWYCVKFSVSSLNPCRCYSLVRIFTNVTTAHLHILHIYSTPVYCSSNQDILTWTTQTQENTQHFAVNSG